MKRSASYESDMGMEDGINITLCDILLFSLFAAIVGFTIFGVHKQKISEENRLQEESILCIKDFDSNNCNPFNMSQSCREKMECIKSGDGLGLFDILEILNKHIKNNGAITILMITIALGNEVRRRMA